MTATPRKSLADKVRENEAAKNDSAPPIVDTDETKNEGTTEVTKPEEEIKSDEETKKENKEEDKEPELTDVVKARMATYGGGVHGNRLITHSGGGRVVEAAVEGATLTNTPSENALARKPIQVEHVYAQPAYEVE